METYRALVKKAFIGLMATLLLGLWGTVTFAQDESVLNIGLSAPVTSLDPHNYRSGIDSMLCDQLFDTLVSRDLEMRTIPRLAKSWERLSPTVWRFHLRQDVTFHDGTRFNAEAVKINLERLIDVDKPPRAGFYVAALAAVEVVDEYTVDLITKVPTPPFLTNLGMMVIAMISPAALEEYGDKVTLHPVGTGKFRFIEWVPGTRLVLAKNEAYFLGAPKLDKVVFSPIPEDVARVMALLSGDVDVIQFPPVEYIQTLTENSKYEILSEDGMRVVGIWFNVERYPFTDILVRKALNYAVDKDVIVDQLLAGAATKASGVLPPGVWGALSYDPYPYDPQKATEFLRQAGWTDSDGDGIVDKDGEPFKVTLATCMGKYYKDTEIATVVQAQLRQIGVDVRVEVWEWGAYLSHLKAREQQFHIQGWGAAPDVDVPLRANFYSGQPWNVMDYSSPQVDALMDKGLQTMNSEERMGYYYEAQRIIVDDAVWIVLYNEPKLYATQNYVKDLGIHPEDRLLLLNTYIGK